MFGIFLRFRFDEKLPYPSRNLTENSYIGEFNKNIARLEKFCGKIFIHGEVLLHLPKIITLGPTPIVPMVHINNFIDAISDGTNLDQFNMNRKVGNLVISFESRCLDSG